MKQIFGALGAMAALCSALCFSSCNKTDTPQRPATADLIKISEGYAAGAAAKVTVYASTGTINTGYTKFYLALSDSASGTKLNTASILLSPMMDMGMMQHASPYENPVSNLATDGLFPCSVVFIMPTTAGNWTVKVQVTNQAKSGAYTFPVVVQEPAKSTIKSFTAKHDDGKYFVTLIQPAKPKVGINDFEIAIYKKQSMMSFPAENNFTVSLAPEMPTMGHGSPNNVNPVAVGNGHYKGKVNFTMTGLWKINLGFMAGAAVADTTQFFEMEF